MAGLVCCKGVCTFISGNASMRFYFLKEELRLRVTDSFVKNFEDVSLDMVTALLWVQRLLSNIGFDGVR